MSDFKITDSSIMSSKGAYNIGDIKAKLEGANGSVWDDLESGERRAQVDDNLVLIENEKGLCAYEYDDEGRLINEYYDYDGDGISDTNRTNYYDKNGEISLVTTDYDADGKNDSFYIMNGNKEVLVNKDAEVAMFTDYDDDGEADGVTLWTMNHGNVDGEYKDEKLYDDQEGTYESIENSFMAGGINIIPDSE